MLNSFFLKNTRSILFFISFCLTGYSFAGNCSQTTPTVTPEKKETVLLNFSGGSSKPLGEYASKDLSRSTSGLALKGLAFQASMVLKLSTYVGACAAYNYQANAFASDAFNKELLASNPGITFTTKTTNWNIKGFYGGLYLTLPVKDINGLSLFGSACVGLPKYVTPMIATTGIDMNTGVKATVTQSSSSTSAAGFLLNGGLLYKFNDFFGINVCANYFSGKAEFKDVYISTSNNTFTYTHFSQKFESLNIQAGVSFIIN